MYLGFDTVGRHVKLSVSYLICRCCLYTLILRATDIFGFSVDFRESICFLFLNPGKCPVSLR